MFLHVRVLIFKFMLEGLSLPAALLDLAEMLLFRCLAFHSFLVQIFFKVCSALFGVVGKVAVYSREQSGSGLLASQCPVLIVWLQFPIWDATSSLFHDLVISISMSQTHRVTEFV